MTMAVTAASYSIRRRILLGAALLLGALTLALAMLAQQFAQRAADEAFDRVLVAAALSIADAVQVDEGSVTVDVPYAAMAILSTSRTNRVFYRVTAPNGALLTGYHDLGFEQKAAQSDRPVFETVTYRGTPVRLVTTGRYVATADLQGYATVMVAETLDARGALSGEIFRNAVLGSLGLSCLAIFLVMAGLSRAFAPFRALEAELRSRRPTDLSGIRTSLPREVSPLLAALDGFMARLAATLERLRDLAAEAAHQVRTPLASLRAQCELALSASDPAEIRERLRRVHVNAVAATQVVNQILADATMTHRLETRRRSEVDLLDLAEELRQRLDDRDLARVQLSTAGMGGETEAVVLGEPFALREMLQNLVVNALTYSDGPVEVAIAHSHGGVTLSVADRGPGIPDVEKTEVFERFRRGRAAGSTTGSGLGLSIARAAAEASGGRLDLLDRPGGGLVAQVGWRRAGMPTAAPATAPASFVLLTALACLAALAEPADARAESWPAPTGGQTILRIATDGEIDLVRRLARLYQQHHPTVAVEIEQLSSGLLAQAVITAPASRAGPDVVISGAVDRQVQLVNDGFALRHRSTETARLPDWARWRDEVFAITAEPVVFLVDPRAFENDVPRTRLRLAQLLEAQQDRFRGRVVTYHVGLNGMGYVFSTFDSLMTPVFWRLARAMGEIEVQFATEPVEMLSALQRGEVSIAYNVAASSSVVIASKERGLALVQPEDYRLIVPRSMLIPRTSRFAEGARDFVDLALSDAGRAAIGVNAIGTESSVIPPLVVGRTERIVPLSPASLIFLDERKRNRFLDTWIQLMVKHL